MQTQNCFLFFSANTKLYYWQGKKIFSYYPKKDAANYLLITCNAMKKKDFNSAPKKTAVWSS